MTISKKRLYILVISIVVGLAIIAGTTTAIVVTRPNTSAYNGTESSVSIGNLLTADGTGINETTRTALFNAVGQLGSVDGTMKAQNINSGSPVIFQMGEVNGNPIYWQVVYRTDDYITVWMCEPYTTARYNGGEAYSVYANSDLRATVTGIYSTYSNLYEIMSLTTEGGIVATPNEMQKDTKMAWQTSGQINSMYNSSYTSISNSLTGEAIYDAFWIPSHYEVANTSTSSENTNNTTTYTGLWGLNSTMRGFNNSSTALDGTSGVGSYCWLRSGSSNTSNIALYVGTSGASGSKLVNNTYGVRPAAHLSLSSIANPQSSSQIGYTITASEASDFAHGSAQVISSTGSASPYESGTSLTIMLTPDSDYICNSSSLKINGSPVTLTKSGNSWRYTFNITQDTTYEFSFTPWINVITNTGTINTIKSINPQTNSGVVTLIPQSNYYISEFSFDGSTYYAIDSWEALVSVGVPFCANIKYSASMSGMLGFTFNYIDMTYFDTSAINLYLRLTTTPYTNLKTTSSVTGVAVTATYGGSVTLIGNDLQNMADTDYITCVAKVCVKNYEFVGWYNVNDMETCLSTYASTNFTKEEVENSQIIAVFNQISNGNVNDDVNN